MPLMEDIDQERRIWCLRWTGGEWQTRWVSRVLSKYVQCWRQSLDCHPTGDRSWWLEGSLGFSWRMFKLGCWATERGGLWACDVARPSKRIYNAVCFPKSFHLTTDKFSTSDTPRSLQLERNKVQDFESQRGMWKVLESRDLVCNTDGPGRAVLRAVLTVNKHW